MLGSHDSFTYMVARDGIINTFPSFWRCQEKTIKEQYDLGVRVFDIRVNKDVQNKKFTWQVSHGLAKFNQNFVSLSAIGSYFKKQYPGSYFRVILESGSNNEEIVTKFKEQAKKLMNSYEDIVWQVVIKSPWTVLYQGKDFKVINDYSCHLFNWNVNRSLWENIKHFDFKSYSIKSWAKKHNPNITQEMKDDPDKLYFMDYVNI